MTVVRRELPLSKSASRPGRKTERRIVSARTLQSCPHRLGADAAQEAARHLVPPLRGADRLRGGFASDRHRGPDEADEFARDGGHGHGRAFPEAHQMPIASVEALLSPPGVGDDRGRLALAPARQMGADARSVAIVQAASTRARRA